MMVAGWVLLGFLQGLLVSWCAFLTWRLTSSSYLNSWRTSKGAAQTLEEFSGVQSRQFETRLKALEMEWDNAYEKLRRQAGRISKTEALEKEPRNEQPAPLTRADVLRRARAIPTA